MKKLTTILAVLALIGLSAFIVWLQRPAPMPTAVPSEEKPASAQPRASKSDENDPASPNDNLDQAFADLDALQE